MFPILMSDYLRCLTNKTVVSVAGCDGTFSHGRATQPAHSPPVFCSNLLVSISSYYHRAFKILKIDLTHHTEYFFLEELTKWMYHYVTNPLDFLLSEDQNHLRVEIFIWQGYVGSLSNPTCYCSVFDNLST